MSLDDARLKMEEWREDLQQRPSPQRYRKQTADIATKWSKGRTIALDQQPGKISSRVAQTWGAAHKLQN